MNTTTRTPQGIEDDDGLGRSLLISLGVHAVGFIIFFVRAVFYPSEPLVLEDAIRVDIVALPDKGKMQELPPPPIEAPPVRPPKAEPAPVEPPKPVDVPKPVVKPPTPEAPAVDIKKTKKNQDAALKRLEAMEKIKKMMEQEASNTKVAAPTVVKGNEVSKGSALKGLARIAQENYLRTVDASVKRRWDLPKWMSDANLSARIRLYVDARGTVVKAVFIKTSGNEDYDARIKTAVEAASPFPAPPNELVNVLSVDGIELEFN
ncbi:MAG: cell envelope integrity protein TolA [Bdellovibrionota bacterium]